MAPEQEEVALSQPMRRAWLTGNKRSAVYRRGQVVVRETGPWGPTVHSLLRHLEEAGFSGAPRVVGSGFDPDGRETLSYIEGEVIDPRPWTLDGAAAIGKLVRGLHDATASYGPAPEAVWPPWHSRDLGAAEKVISHCDIAPWNIVSRQGVPVALIDWELAGPVDPLVDLAHATWLNARLHGDDELLSLADRARQMRAIVDAYGLSAPARDGFIDLMIDVVVLDTAFQADEAGVGPDTRDVEALWGLAWRARAGAWLVKHRNSLQQALLG